MVERPGGHVDDRSLRRDQLAGKTGVRIALVGVDVDAREALALEDIAKHGTVRVECRAGAVDRGRTLGVPAVPLIAHALNPHRPAYRPQTSPFGVLKPDFT